MIFGLFIEMAAVENSHKLVPRPIGKQGLVVPAQGLGTMGYVFVDS